MSVEALGGCLPASDAVPAMQAKAELFGESGGEARLADGAVSADRECKAHVTGIEEHFGRDGRALGALVPAGHSAPPSTTARAGMIS